MTSLGNLSSTIPATSEALAEAETLSADILQSIELSQVPLSVIVLKAMRLSRLLNDFEAQQIFQWESSGYPHGVSNTADPETWVAGERAGRRYHGKDSTHDNPKLYMYMESIEQLEHTIAFGKTGLQAAQDPNISISSSNQYQSVRAPIGNSRERRTIRERVNLATQRLAARRTLIYDYALRKHYEIRFAGVADDVFRRVRSAVDASIGSLLPDSVRKFTAVYDNLKSDNPEDWANAVHSCRRVLQDLADALFPPQDGTRTRRVNGKDIEIGLKENQYVNRIIAYVEDSSESDRFEEIVGSNLSYMGERLDAIFGATQKGSHATVTKEEADRCLIYTYLLVGDILSLRSTEPTPMRIDMTEERSLDVQETQPALPPRTLS